ncbi:MAG: hypothetical protein A3I44_01550 [Candidatus Sungbacteria bacterium RIFCSPLOWO2_02_FULL_51_17]|nr:MAG: hypothetical protein A3I44_01550 [Candidatus Sungbacteria bacterium RIFCSPLOWO2_02_FULL_51_17]
MELGILFICALLGGLSVIYMIAGYPIAGIGAALMMLSFFITAGAISIVLMWGGFALVLIVRIPAIIKSFKNDKK